MRLEVHHHGFVARPFFEGSTCRLGLLESGALLAGMVAFAIVRGGSVGAWGMVGVSLLAFLPCAARWTLGVRAVGLDRGVLEVTRGTVTRIPIGTIRAVRVHRRALELSTDRGRRRIPLRDATPAQLDALAGALEREAAAARSAGPEPAPPAIAALRARA